MNMKNEANLFYIHLENMVISTHLGCHRVNGEEFLDGRIDSQKML